MGSRTCTKCANSFPESNFYKRKRKYKSGKIWEGYEAWCIPCFREQGKSYVEKHKTEYTTYQKGYREAHRQKLREAAKEYRKLPSVRAKAKLREQTLSRKLYRKLRREWRKFHEEGYKEHLSGLAKKANKKYLECHQEEVRKRARTNSRIRRAQLKTGMALRAIPDDLEKILLKWRHGRCFYCLTPLSSEPRKIHMDHIVPLSRGGLHDRKNLCLACQTCNESKQNKILFKEWSPKFEWKEFPIHDLLEIEGMRFLILRSFFLRTGFHPVPKHAVKMLREQYPDLFIFWDFEWEHKSGIILNMLRAKYGKCLSAGARTLKLGYPSPEESWDFLDKYHLQGKTYGSFYNGLYDKTGNLKAVAVWKEMDSWYELVRLAFEGHVIGGFSRLLKDFQYQIGMRKPLISFVDTRYANGHSYTKVGFQFVFKSPESSMAYVCPTGVINRQFLMKKKMKICNFPHLDLNKTEWENAAWHGYFQVWALPFLKFKISENTA